MYKLKHCTHSRIFVIIFCFFEDVVGLLVPLVPSLSERKLAILMKSPSLILFTSLLVLEDSLHALIHCHHPY